jgi:hypothetical protein
MLKAKRRKIVLLGSTMLPLIVALTLAVSTALATHAWTPESITCNPRSHSVTVTGYLAETNGNSIGGDLYVDGVNEGWYQENPSGSPGIYSITITHPDIDYGTTVEVVDSENEAVETDCREKGEPVIPYTGIYLMSPAAQAPYMQGDNPPCGVFDVNGWGAKYVGLGDFPGCTAPVTVMCLNGEGEWTADNVSGVVMKGDWEVDFISHQDGICALFPAS